MKSEWIVCLGLSCAIACGQQATQPTPPRPVQPTPPGPVTLRVTGTVVENGGGPVAEASVEATCSSDRHSQAQTLTDTFGGFSLTLDAATATVGCVFLRVQKTGYATETVQVREKLEGVTINLQRERRVSGRIVEFDGGPVEGVRISNAGSLPLSTAFSDANGFFVITGVAKFINLVNEDFVSGFVEVPIGQDVDLGTVHLQRRILVNNGSRVSSRLSAEDVVSSDSYPMWDLGIWCAPCKRFDLDGRPEELIAELQWSGAIPLQLWATDFYTDVIGRPEPGASALTLRLPPTARFLLVGVPSSTFSPQPLQQPIDFDLSVTGR
jgi:hypothetical protein